GRGGDRLSVDRAPRQPRWSRLCGVRSRGKRLRPLAPMNPGSDLRIRDLVVRFDTTVAVDGVDLAIEAGEVFLLLGPSGCGKTTLLRTIAGFCEAVSGSIHFGSVDVTRL